MKINKRILLFGAATALFIGALPLSIAPQKGEDIAPDNIQYEDNKVVKLNEYLAAGEDEEIICPNRVTLHYVNDDGKNDTRLFYTWVDGKSGIERAPTSISDDRKEMSITIDFANEDGYLNKDKMFLIIKYKGTWDEQSEDTIIDYAKFPPDADGLLELWIVNGEGSSLELYRSKEETQFDKITTAKFTSWQNIHCVATAKPTSYKVYAFDQTYLNMEVVTQARDKELYLFKTGTPDGAEFDIKLNKLPHINVLYLIESWFESKPSVTQKVYVGMEKLYDDSRFNKLYTYTGENSDDLGVTIDKENNQTTFKLWAPTCANVLLKIYKTGTPKSYYGGTSFAYTYRMVYQQYGIWTITLEGNLSGKYYTYVVDNVSGRNEVVDPYAKACGVNGLRGMVLDFSTTNPENWDNDVPAIWDGNGQYDIKTPQELAIYEAHIRDLTMDDSWNGKEEQGTYKAFIEKGTTYTDTEKEVTVTTGFDHIEEMGVNAIQLTPVFDNDNDESFEFNEAGEKVKRKTVYNWGYNPLNYNCVEGGYSSDPYNGEVRVKEFKELIQAFAKNNNHTRVIMDVVYNHVNSGANCNFSKIMPRYYFRFKENGAFHNGTDCGNEVKTEARMMSKFIVDSLKWWASEYRIKGFRFDLMGCIDVKTLKAAKEELYKIDKDIYLYGEGWASFGGAHVNGLDGTTRNVYEYLYDSPNSHGYVGCFNDAGRDSLKGKNDFGEDMHGFISRGADKVGDRSNKVADMIAGYHSGSGASRFDPKQSVAYASCHDNYTLFDQLTYTVGNNGANSYYPDNVCAAVAACESAVLFSNSVAFIQGGEELFRTKEVKSEDDLKLITKTDEEGHTYYSDTSVINGKIISHNSYNLSDDVNAYDWSRKISIGNKDTLKYVEQIQNAVRLRKHLTKYSKEDMDNHNPYNSSSSFHVFSAESSWDGNTAVGVKNGDYYFFIAGNRDSKISFNEFSTYNNVVYGELSEQGTNYIKLGWSKCVCLTDSSHGF